MLWGASELITRGPRLRRHLKAAEPVIPYMRKVHLDLGWDGGLFLRLVAFPLPFALVFVVLGLALASAAWVLLVPMSFPAGHAVYTETAARLVARTQRRARREYFVRVEEPAEDTERAEVLYRAAVGAGPAA